MKEEWKRSNHIDVYEVSNKGRVRNSKTGQIVKSQMDESGEDVVYLYDHGKKRKKRVKRLVAETYLDGDVNNSYIERVEPNMQHDRNRTENLKLRSKRKGKKIRVVETGEIFDSITECSKALGMSVSSISKCTNYSFYGNKLGYHFEEVE